MKPPDACYHLCNKAYFFTAPEAFKDKPVLKHSNGTGDQDVEPQPLSTPFWCLKTHEALGPDGEEARDDLCDATRSCYRPEVTL